MDLQGGMEHGFTGEELKLSLQKLNNAVQALVFHLEDSSEDIDSNTGEACDATTERIWGPDWLSFTSKYSSAPRTKRLAGRLV